MFDLNNINIATKKIINMENITVKVSIAFIGWWSLPVKGGDAFEYV